VLGRNTPGGTLEANTLVNQGAGFLITNAVSEGLGMAVGGGLDVNGDGRSDIVPGAPSGATNLGRVYVVFGATMPAEIPALDISNGKRGFVLQGEQQNSGVGNAVALLPSVDNDLLADILIGAPQYDVLPGGSSPPFAAADPATEAGPQPSASPGMSMSTKRRMIGRPVCQ